MPITHTTAGTPIGDLTLVADDGKLTGVYFPHHWYRPATATFGPRAEDGFGEAKRQLAEYFAGDRERFDLPLEFRGDAFSRRVWELIGRIPYGETVTYGDLAREVSGKVPGHTASAKDVGAAVGRNPLCVLVPCHRVVGKDGRLTGYAGGLARKRYLLLLEESNARTPVQPLWPAHGQPVESGQAR